MAVIEEGFNSQLLHMRFSKSASGSIEVNIEQEGLNTGNEKRIQRYETLSYATLGEIMQLRDELNAVIKDVVGL